MSKEGEDVQKRYEEMKKLEGWGAGIFIGPGAKGNHVIGNRSKGHRYGVVSHGDGTIIKENHSDRDPKPE